MITLPHLLLIGLGGALGSMSRALISVGVPAGKLPWGTMTANVVGSLIIGLALGRLGDAAGEQSPWHGFVVIGFCGGFTTFSSFSWQTLEHLRSGQAGTAFTHVVVSVAVCLLATWAGWRMGRI
ncbi:fluoride efflux transporter CrcB [Synoicihabitans lomoniglobus]|uniref:Fluoride-specific ion channel FluC n=1 Tax=Synoicihabitans lomoniglobus TaxID=2909285 RepID=A0AAF0CPU3_9BACT|nr:fluoride efflux transporter CrcB [Opitutaceae bacterium LMO-M01]WED65824.1 fluoride efflux transporter CrcB [Opitutaceae bacterium LMO-M01]